MKRFYKQASVVISIIVAITIIMPSFAEASSVGGVSISSKAAVVMDFDTGLVLWGYNEDTQMIPASMIKMIAIHCVYDAIKEGRISLNSRVTISQGVSDFSYNLTYSNVPLARGSTPTVRDLIHIVVIFSACAAVIALADGVFGGHSAMVTKMNQKAADLGVQATFRDCWGGSENNRISARGLAIMSRALIEDHPEILDVTSRRFATFNGLQYPTTNQLLGAYTGLDGLKTGYTDPAGYCFIGTAKRDGRRLISVTMGSTQQSRNPDTRAILNHGFAVADELVAEYLKSIEDGTEHPDPDVPIFSDVADNYWAYDVVIEVYSRGLMVGVDILPDGSIQFAPSGVLSRAAVAQILYNAYNTELQKPGATGIADVVGSDWFSPAVNWLVGNGLADTRSTENGRLFSPDAPASRAFMAETLFRIAAAMDVTLPELSPPSDFPDVNEGNVDFVLALQQSGVITGYPDGTFRPDNTLLREQAAALMLRFTDIDGLETAVMRLIADLSVDAVSN